MLLVLKIQKSFLSGGFGGTSVVSLRNKLPFMQPPGGDAKLANFGRASAHGLRFVSVATMAAYFNINRGRTNGQLAHRDRTSLVVQGEWTFDEISDVGVDVDKEGSRMEHLLSSSQI